MGRLENIVARNRRPNRVSERAIWSMVFGAIVLLVLFLAVFTDLGAPPGASAGAGAAPAPPVPAVAPGHAEHVDGVLLRHAPKKR